MLTSGHSVQKIKGRYMKLEGYYSSGEFAKKAHVTKKTIRYYDEHNILKPSFVSDSGARFYSDEDFARLQQILFKISRFFTCRHKGNDSEEF